MSVDWAATGQMLSGIGAIGGGLAVAYAAFTGANTFEKWKIQRREERRMALAEEILTVAYEFERVIGAIRSPATYGYESDAAEQSLREQYDDFDRKSDFQKNVLKQAQVILTRFGSHSSFWDRFFAVFPTARAFFGQPVFDALQALWVNAVSVRAAAQTYGGYRTSGDDFMRKLEARFWEGAEDPDVIKSEVTRQVKLLDDILLKVLGN